MKRAKRRETPSGRFAFEGLDRVLHEKARLGILSSLAANPEGLVFNEIKDLCRLTDGNLNRHMQVLQEAGMVEIWKGHRGKRPQTLVRLTEEGRARFMAYINVLESIVAQNLDAVQDDRSPDVAGRYGGWSPA